MSVSPDGGRTWSAGRRTADDATATRGIPLVRPDGTVVVLMDNWLPADPSTEVRSFTSDDGGRTWGPSHLVAALKAAPSPLNGLGSFNTSLGTAAVDGAGTIYAVWSDCRFRQRCTGNDLVMSTSENGVTWTKVTRVTNGENVDTPGVGADPLTGGRLGITYYDLDPHCQGADCLIQARFISSSDGGTTWNRPITLAGPMHGSWLARLPQGVTGVTLGNHIGTTVLPSGNAITIFPFATEPGDTTLHQDMHTVAGGIPIHGKQGGRSGTW